MAMRAVDFYALPVSMSSGEYPLFTDAGAPSTYLKHTLSTVKVTYDMDQDLTVPTFDGYEEISMVHIGGIGYYWVVGVEISTIYNESIVFHLRYCAISSNIRTGESVKGIWTRRPTIDPKVQQTISNSAMTARLLGHLPTMSGVLMLTNKLQGDTKQVFWVQITSSNYINSSGGVTSGRITRYGTFAVNISESTGVGGFLAYSSTATSADNTYLAYPTIGDIFNNLTAVTGIEASSVLDISVIPICPYMFSERGWTSSDGTTTYHGNYITLDNRSGDEIIPTIGKDVTYNPIVSGGVKQTFKFRIYNLDINTSIDTFIGAYYPVERTSDTLSFNLSNFYQNVGQIEIRNWEGNAIGTLPNIGSVRSLSIRYISDSTGIYTIIHDSYSNSHYVMPCGKIPWVGTQWDTYKAYSMDTDRKSIEFAQAQYDKQFQSDMANAAFNGVLGAGVAGMSGNVTAAAVGGLTSLASGVVSGYLGREMNNMKLAQDQELTEMRIKASPAIAYSTSYGLNQIKLMEMYGGGIYVLIPYDVDTDYHANYVTEFGYPTEGVQTLTIKAGYYKGRILTTDDMTGVIFNRLQEEFNNGLKLKQF